MQWWKRFSTFLREVVVETKKVTWPSKQEIINTTTVVVVASFIFGLYLYFCDFVFLVMRDKVFELFGVFAS
jgi:preprotein translocase subunit SecE